MTERWHLAQVNIAKALYPTDDTRMAGFMNRLDTVNALAEQSPGFVWRLQSDSGNATDIDVGDDPNIIVNLSVWESVGALFEFAYKTAHREVLVRRREWFERPRGAYQALWWIPAGTLPTVVEAMAKIELIDRAGPGPDAFGFRKTFPPPGGDSASEDLEPAPWCAGWD